MQLRSTEINPKICKAGYKTCQGVQGFICHSARCTENRWRIQQLSQTLQRFRFKFWHEAFPLNFKTDHMRIFQYQSFMLVHTLSLRKVTLPPYHVMPFCRGRPDKLDEVNRMVL